MTTAEAAPAPRADTSRAARNITEWLLVGAVALVALWHLAFIYRNFVRAKSVYTYGDWTINYAGGFVRRGLGGETLLFLSNTLNMRLEVLSAAVVAALSLAFLLGVLALMRRRARPLDVALLLSPAALLFPVLDPSNAGRKDVLVLLLAVAGGALLMAGTQARDDKLRHLAALTALAVVLSLVHETVVFYALAPLLLFLLVLTRQGHGAVGLVAVGLALAVLAVTLVVVSATTQVTPATVQAICGRLADHAPQGCAEFDSAVGWLQRDTAYGIQTVADRIGAGLYPGLYAFGFSVGIAVMTGYALLFRASAAVSRRLRYGIGTPVLHVMLFLVASLPLYVVAIDWGRWFAMWFTVSLLYLLYGEAVGIFERRGAALRASGNWLVAGGVVGLNLLWSLPHCCSAVPTLGIKLLSVVAAAGN